MKQYLKWPFGSISYAVNEPTKKEQNRIINLIDALDSKTYNQYYIHHTISILHNRYISKLI